MPGTEKSGPDVTWGDVGMTRPWFLVLVEWAEIFALGKEAKKGIDWQILGNIQNHGLCGIQRLHLHTFDQKYQDKTPKNVAHSTNKFAVDCQFLCLYWKNQARQTTHDAIHYTIRCTSQNVCRFFHQRFPYGLTVLNNSENRAILSA